MREEAIAPGAGSAPGRTFLVVDLEEPTRQPFDEAAESQVPDDYLRAMVRRSVPPGVSVVAGSTPVVAFGDPARAEVATLGINPSKVEFIENGLFLSGSSRRLATLESLGASDMATLTDSQVLQVVEDCARYFDPDRNPYRRWFDPLDRLLRDAIDVSYYKGTACHLDLVQWATDPVWRGIEDEDVRRILLEDGLPHLRAQLRRENIRLVLLNGRTVIDQVQAVGLADLIPAGGLALGRTTCSLYAGSGEGVRFIGWSTNLQSSRGVSNAFKTELAAWLAEHAAGLETTKRVPPPPEEIPVADAELPLDAKGYVMKGTTVGGKRALAALLKQWLGVSTATTIGVGTFGGSPCVRIQLGDVQAVLNADTKRAAIELYLDTARREGADRPWSVIANRRGRVNKVVFREDKEETPGWFCYLTEPFTTPGEV